MKIKTLIENIKIFLFGTTCYKIVKIEKDGLYSYCPPNKPLSLKYEEKRWTHAKIGGLLVFEDMDAVRRLAHHSFATKKYYKIFKAKARGKVKLPKNRQIMFPNNTVEELEEAVRNVWSNKDPVNHNHTWPFKTMAFRKVKLIEEMKWD